MQDRLSPATALASQTRATQAERLDRWSSLLRGAAVPLPGLRQWRHVQPLSQGHGPLPGIAAKRCTISAPTMPPPYFTIVIVGHIVVGLVLALEVAYRPPALAACGSVAAPDSVAFACRAADHQGRARRAAMGAPGCTASIQMPRKTPTRPFDGGPPKPQTCVLTSRPPPTRFRIVV